jgi:hypothetical protein
VPAAAALLAPGQMRPRSTGLLTPPPLRLPAPRRLVRRRLPTQQVIGRRRHGGVAAVTRQPAFQLRYPTLQSLDRGLLGHHQRDQLLERQILDPRHTIRSPHKISRRTHPHRRVALRLDTPPGQQASPTAHGTALERAAHRDTTTTSGPRRLTGRECLERRDKPAWRRR